MARVTADRLFSAGILESGDFTFHGGQAANNHVSMERLFDPGNEAILEDSVEGLAQLAWQFGAEVLVGIPSGGTELAEMVSDKMFIPTSRLKKVGGSFEFTARQEQRRVERLGRLVIVDDVATRLSSLERVMQIPAIRAKAAGFVAILCRGLVDDQLNLPLPKNYLVQQYIPARLPADSPLWSHAR